MRTRPLLLSHAPASPINPVNRNLFEKYFDVEEYRKDQQYDPASTLVVVPNWEPEPWCERLYNQGFGIVIDNLWETKNTWKMCKQYQSWDVNRIHIMQTPNWFWYHESLRLCYTQFQYTPEPTYQHLALMPMNLLKDHRTRLYLEMRPWLQDCYWSYHGMGYHCMPNDNDMEDWSSQRYVNVDWYNHTCFSMVAETHHDDSLHKKFGPTAMPFQGPWPFVTEKTFKPIQYQHPFMVYGQCGILKFLKDLGFETFDNLFDESYDSINSHHVARDNNASDEKLKIIIENVKNFEKGSRDRLTQQKIQHNHAHFTDMALVESRFIKEIIEPLLEFCYES
jgi:hypothetical protein